MINKIRMIMNSGSIVGYFIQVLPVTIIAGAIYVVLRFIFIKRRNIEILWLTEILRFIFVCYLIGLINLIVLPANFWLHFFDGIFLGWWDGFFPIFRLGEINISPAVLKCLKGELILGSWVKTMLIGNIAMFVPFGFLFPFITKTKKLRQMLLTFMAVPVFVELMQLFFGRSFDIDDLICNFFGILVGAGLAFVITKIKPSPKNKLG